MSEQEKKLQRIYDLLNAEIRPKFLCVPYTKHIIFFFFFTEKELLRKRWCGGLNKKRKESILTALIMAMKKDPSTSIRKHSNGLKVHEKTVRAAIKVKVSDHSRG